MRVSLTKADFESIVAHARACLPEEACGLVAGIRSKDAKEIRKVYLLENIDHTSEHFTLDPREQLKAVKDMRANGYEPLGNWHSHPETPSRPSQEDIRLAYDSTASYLILSLENREQPVLKSFHVEGGLAVQEKLEIRS